MKTPITPEALIEMGFEQNEHKYQLRLRHVSLEFNILSTILFIKIDVWITDAYAETNATTIEDVKDLIRLFK